MNASISGVWVFSSSDNHYTRVQLAITNVANPYKDLYNGGDAVNLYNRYGTATLVVNGMVYNGTLAVNRPIITTITREDIGIYIGATTSTTGYITKMHTTVMGPGYGVYYTIDTMTSTNISYG